MSDTSKRKEGEKRSMKTALHHVVEKEQNIFKMKASFELPLLYFLLWSFCSLLRNLVLNVSFLVHENKVPRGAYVVHESVALSLLLSAVISLLPSRTHLFSVTFAYFWGKINRDYPSIRHIQCSPFSSAFCLYCFVFKQNYAFYSLSLQTSALNSFTSQVNHVFSFHFLVTR